MAMWEQGEKRREGTRCNSQGGQRYKRGGQPIKRIATALRKRSSLRGKTASSLFRGCPRHRSKKSRGVLNTPTGLKSMCVFKKKAKKKKKRRGVATKVVVCV